MVQRSFRFSITLPLICFLILGFALTVGAKPRKKSKKQRQSAARIKRDLAAQWALLNQSVAATSSPGDGIFAANSGRDSSVVSSTSQSSSNAQFIGDPEAPSPDVHPAVAAAGQIIISEFRVRGPNGANDEFIELYNNSGADHTVAAASGSGYGVAASDNTTRCVIPNGTVIPNRGHYLCINSVGYSLASYPAGNGTTATGDATYTT